MTSSRLRELAKKRLALEQERVHNLFVRAALHAAQNTAVTLRSENALVPRGADPLRLDLQVERHAEPISTTRRPVNSYLLGVWNYIWHFIWHCCWPSLFGVNIFAIVKVVLIIVGVLTVTNVHPLIQLRGAACGHNVVLDTVLACPTSIDFGKSVARVNNHVELILGRSMHLPLSHSIQSVKLLITTARSEILKSSVAGKAEIIDKYTQILLLLDAFEIHANRLAAQSSNSFGLIYQEVKNAISDLDSLASRNLLLKKLVPDGTKIAARFSRHAAMLERAVAQMEVPLLETVSAMQGITQQWTGIRDDWALHTGFHRECGYSLGWSPFSSETQEWKYNSKALAEIGNLITVAEGKTSNISIYLGPLMAEFPTLKDKLVPQDHELFSANMRSLGRSLDRLDSTLLGVSNARPKETA